MTTLHLATVYLLSPEDTPAGSEPGPDWTPHVKHRVFWNLVHAVNFEPPAARHENMTLFTGLAGGVADGLIQPDAGHHQRPERGSDRVPGKPDRGRAVLDDLR